MAQLYGEDARRPPALVSRTAMSARTAINQPQPYGMYNQQPIQQQPSRHQSAEPPPLHAYDHTPSSQLWSAGSQNWRQLQKPISPEHLERSRSVPLPGCEENLYAHVSRPSSQQRPVGNNPPRRSVNYQQSQHLEGKAVPPTKYDGEPSSYYEFDENPKYRHQQGQRFGRSPSDVDYENYDDDYSRIHPKRRAREGRIKQRRPEYASDYDTAYSTSTYHNRTDGLSYQQHVYMSKLGLVFGALSLITIFTIGIIYDHPDLITKITSW